MHIEHTTYDQAREPATSSRPTSAAKKAKDFISSHIKRHSADPKYSTGENTAAERLVNLWPRGGVTSPSYAPGEKVHTGEDSKARLGDTDGSKTGKAESKSFDLQRQKQNLSESWTKLTRAGSKGFGESRRRGLDKIQRLKKLRVVIPPTQIAPKEHRSAPALPLSSRGYLITSPRAMISPDPRTAGAADASAGKFQDPFTRPGSPSRRNSAVFPISEKNEDKAVGSKPARGDEETKLSGKGKNLWREGPLDPCRLCKKGSAVGIRGLCGECEGEFASPHTLVQPGAGGGYGDEVKPTPPLKDKNFLSSGKIAGEGRPASEVDGGSGSNNDDDSWEDDWRGDPDEENGGSRISRVRRSSSFYDYWDDILKEHGMTDSADKK